MKYNKLRVVLLGLLLITVTAFAQIDELQGETTFPKDMEKLVQLEGKFTYLIASDLGRNGYYDQKPIAEMMGVVARITDLEFVAALGDVHHFRGIQSVDDPLWQTNYEWIYKHPSLMLPWYPLLGNHEYEGNTDAVVEYSNVSRRWDMPSKYYAKTFDVSDESDAKALLLWIDTPRLIDKYRDDSEEWADIQSASIEKELNWIDSTLSASDAKWKIVMGHHPVYAGTYKDDIERTDLQKRLQPLLDKYKVDISIGGHVHNFQHIQVEGSDVDYFINSSASQTRNVDPLSGQLFGSSDSGFTLCTITDTELTIIFINKEGKILYQYSRSK